MKAALTIALTLSLFAAIAPPPARPQSSSSASPLVKEISLFRDGAGRVAWSAQGDWLAFDARDPEHGNYQLWVMKRDGTFERCLTCEPLDLRRENCINPTWHPSGDWIVFQLQSQAKRLGFGPVELATGDRGLWSEIEVIRRDGRGFWQLTRVHENGGTVLDPQFSFEGDQILWSERVRSRVGRWGTWALRVAQFRGGAVPRLAKPRTFEPGEQRLYLSGSSFTPDDQGALIAGNLDPGQPENGMDVYRLAFEGGAVERLTHTPRGWDERATYTVKGDRILWVSASEITLRDVGRAVRGANGTRPEGVVNTTPGGREPALPIDLLRDLWVMNADGTNQERLTFFNEPSSRESLKAAIVDDFAQSPDGGEILAHVVWSADGEAREGLYLIRLDESFRR
jgi:Tol biopolymer transport system component